MSVPFVGCMLSVAMLLRLNIEVPEIDKTFMESLPRIQDAYRKMYPYANFKLEVIAQKVVRCLNYCSPPPPNIQGHLFSLPAESMQQVH